MLRIKNYHIKYKIYNFRFYNYFNINFNLKSQSNDCLLIRYDDEYKNKNY